MRAYLSHRTKLPNARRQVLTDACAERGRTMTSPTQSHLASEEKKSRLYCAIPPCPPNASVTSARTRNEISPLRCRSGRRYLEGPPPRPRTFIRCKRRNSPPLLDALVALQPRLDRGCKSGLRTFNDFRRKWYARTVRKQTLGLRPISGSDRCQMAQQFAVDQRNAHFERMRHAGPIGIAQQLIAHVQRGFKHGDLAKAARSAWAATELRCAEAG